MSTIRERAAEAERADTSPARLRELASDASVDVRCAVANHATTPIDVLELLMTDSSSLVREVTARNPRPDVRQVAVRAVHADARAAAAGRTDLDLDDTRHLAADLEKRVRARLAEATSNTEVAIHLSYDADDAVRAAVLENEALPDADVERLANDPRSEVRAAAAAARRVRPETLTKLAGDRSAAVRWCVLVYNPERLDLARLLADDSDSANANQARAQLADPRDFTAHLGPVELVE